MGNSGVRQWGFLLAASGEIFVAIDSRAGAHKHCTLEAGMWLVGTTYNLVWSHRSLAEGRTPAMAAGLTDHRWSMEEVLAYPVPPAQLPRWRGRKPKWLLEAERAT